MKNRRATLILLALSLVASSPAISQRASIKETRVFQKIPARAVSPSDVFKKVSPSVVVITIYDADKAPIATGSGVVIPNSDPNLTLIATNCHVVNQAAEGTFIGVGQSEGSGLAWVIGRNDARDLCTVTGPIGKMRNGVMLKGKDGKYLMFKPPAAQIAPTNQLGVGDKVYAIGSPKGLGNTLSDGLISGFRQYNGSKIIQTTAPISPGSSGGGLFDAQGRLVGITTMYLDGGQNLNFAVPAELISSVPQIGRSNRQPTATNFSPPAKKIERWLLVDTNIDNGIETYLDTQSAITYQTEVTTWMKTRWPSPQSADSEVFDEVLMNQIYHCATRQISTIYASRYLRGTMISSMEMQLTRVVTPGTVDEKIYRTICRQ